MSVQPKQNSSLSVRMLHLRVQDLTFCGFKSESFPYETDTACLPHKAQAVLDHGGFVLCGVCSAEFSLHRAYAHGDIHSCGCAVCIRL
jgi:hypothetical protein